MQLLTSPAAPVVIGSFGFALDASLLPVVSMRYCTGVYAGVEPSVAVLLQQRQAGNMRLVLCVVTLGWGRQRAHGGPAELAIVPRQGMGFRGVS